jgi:hypothetical protein
LGEKKKKKKGPALRLSLEKKGLVSKEVVRRANVNAVCDIFVGDHPISMIRQKQ